MKKTLTNGDMVEIFNGIVNFQKREQEYFEKTGKKLLGSRIKIAYAIRKTKENLKRALKPYDEILEELMKRCNSEEAAKKNIFKVSPDHREEWNQELKELQDIETEVDIYTFKLDNLKDVELDVTDLEALSIMIED